MSIKHKQLLFFNNHYISLAVISFTSQNKHLCYYKEIKLNKDDDIKTKIFGLKSHAEAYLYKTINEAELIIDNRNISCISCNENYDNCNDENDLIIQIIKHLESEKNCFTKDVVLKEKTIDNQTKKAKVTFDAYVLEASVVNQIYHICTQLGIKITTIKSILNTFASKNVNSETVIHFDDDDNLQVIQYKYEKIVKIISTRQSYYDFIIALAKNLDVSAKETEKMLDIVNLLIKNQSIVNKDINISSQLGRIFFDTRNIKLSSFLAQVEKTFLMCLDKENISLSSSQNKIFIFGKHQNIFSRFSAMVNNTQVRETYIIGQEKMRLSQQICLANLDIEQKNGPIDILRTKDIKKTLTFLDVTASEDYTVKN